LRAPSTGLRARYIKLESGAAANHVRVLTQVKSAVVESLRYSR
jgi:hypothetical protein